MIATGPDRRRMPSRRSAAKARWPRTRPTDDFEAGGDTTARTRTCRSGRQAVAALVAPRLEDGPPRPGGHAMPEAVSLRSLAVVGLIRALHCVLFCGRPIRPDRMAATARSRRERSGAACAAPGRNGRGRTPDQAIHPRHAPRQATIARDASHHKQKVRKFTPWMPVDRVVRCAATDGTGVLVRRREGEPHPCVRHAP